jgi:hypothetical protein
VSAVHICTLVVTKDFMAHDKPLERLVRRLSRK